MVVSRSEQDNEDIGYVRERVLRKFPLLGVTMASLETVADNSMSTAATDGQKVYYSPDFFKTLTDDEKVFVYAHEVMHVAFNHILRSKDRNQRLWNIATDAVVNQILKNEELPLVEGSVDMAEAANHSAEEMYEKLLQEQQKKEQSGQDGQDNQDEQSGQSEESGQDSSNEDEQSGQDGQDNQDEQSGQSEESGQDSSDEDEQSGQDGQDNQEEQSEQSEKSGQGSSDEDEQVGHDSHEIWKQAVERAEKQQQKKDKERKDDAKEKGRSFLDKVKDLFNKEKTPSEDKESEESPSTEEKPENEKQNSSGLSGQNVREKGQENEWEKNFEEENRRERQNRAAQIRRNLEQQKNAVMKNMMETGNSLGPVGESKAVLDWKKLLKKTIEKEEDRWSYRRSDADNDYMARVEELEEENKAETEVMLDVSGSVDEQMLKEFLRQLKPILKNSKLKVGCFDHRLFGFREIKNNRDIDNFNIPGGGGTDIDLAVRAFSKKKEVNKIVFTDGDSESMPRKDLKGMNVIWLIYDNDDFHPVCGKVIYVNRKQIQQRFLNMAGLEFGGR